MTQLVLPSHTNALDTIFGGTVMSWIDVAAATSAMKHARGPVVTASVDALHFIAPIKKGQIVHIQSMANFTGRTSMEIGVRVDTEDPETGKTWLNVTAYLTFVAIDKKTGKPTEVPPLAPETDAEKRRFEEAKIRRKSRITLANEIKEGRNQATGLGEPD